MPDPRPEDFGLKIVPPGPRPEDFGLKVAAPIGPAIESATKVRPVMDRAQGKLGMEMPPTGTINEQHPDLTWGERTKAMSLTANPQAAERYLQSLNYETKPFGGYTIGIRRPGEKDWHQTESTWPELSDITDVGGDVATLAGQIIGGVGGTFVGLPAAPATFGVAPFVTGAAGAAAGGAGMEAEKAILAKYLGMDPTWKDTGNAMGREALIGATSELAGPVLNAGAKAAYKYGAKPAAEGIGKMLQWPFKVEVKAEARTGDILAKIGGRKAQLDELASREAIDKEFAATQRSKASEDAFNSLRSREAQGGVQEAEADAFRGLQQFEKGQVAAKQKAAAEAEKAAAKEAERQSSQMKAARSATEGSVKASDAAVNAENRRIIFSTRQQQKQLKEELKGLKEEMQSVIGEAKSQKIQPHEHGEYNAISNDIGRIENEIAENDKLIGQYADKINESQVRGAQYREEIAGRKAQEATQGVKPTAPGAIRELPTLEEPTGKVIPVGPQPHPEIAPLKETHDIFKGTREKVRGIQSKAHWDRHESVKQVKQGVIDWDQRAVLADQISNNAAKLADEEWDDAFRKAVQVYERQGQPRAQAIKSAASDKAEQEITAAVEKPAERTIRELPSLSEQIGQVRSGRATEEPLEEMMTRVSNNTLKNSLGEIKSSVQIGPKTAYRLTLGVGTRGAALLGYMLEHSPETLEKLLYATPKAKEIFKSLLDPKAAAAAYPFASTAINRSYRKEPEPEKKPNRMKAGR